MQNMYSAPIPEGWQYMAMAVALALVVPIGLLFYIWIATLWRGTIAPRRAAALRAAARSRRWPSASPASSPTP